MHQEGLQLTSSVLLIIALIFVVIDHFATVFGGGFPSAIYNLLFLFSFIFFLLSLGASPRPKPTWKCQKCHAILRRREIKFGLCPHCGVKIQGFEGLKWYVTFANFE